MARYNKNRFGSIVLQDKKGNDFTITKKEQQTIKTLVKRANTKREYYSKQFYNEVKSYSNMKGVSQEAYKKLLDKKGFITEKYSTDFNKLKNKEEVKDFIKELKGVTKKGFYNNNNKAMEIRKSMIKRVNENYNSIGSSLVKKIKGLSNTQLMSLYIHNDDVVEDIYGSDIDDDVLEFLVERIKNRIDRALKED